MKRPSIALSAVLLAITASLWITSAQARDYLIEIVIFETINGREEAAGGLYFPKIGKSLRLNTDASEQAGFLPVQQGLTLTDNASSINNSGRYRLLTHMAWRQPGLDEQNAVPVRISLGQTSPVFLPEDIQPYETFIPASASATPENPRQVNTSTVNGTIKVRLGRFLHMEVLLAFTDHENGQSFRLSQSRKMRSRELHYIDNPRFGLLTRILPLEEPDTTSNTLTGDAVVEDDDTVDAPVSTDGDSQTQNNSGIKAQPSTE